MDHEKTDLTDLSREELAAFFRDLGEKPFRAGQVMKWLFNYGVADFEQMTNLSKDLRSRLVEIAAIGRLKALKVEESSDGTVKFLWSLSDGAAMESVLMPQAGHYTLCVSSQVGCAMGCRFCRTGTLGLRRNLRPGEIIGQFLQARASLADKSRLTNLVFMGMGEPLANRANVVRALKILTEPGLAGLSRRRLSLSTVGLIPELPLLSNEVALGLTVSLNAADDQTRDYLMPINRRYPLAALHDALAAYPLPHGRRITIAYVLLAGVNDSTRDAVNLAKYLHGLKVKVNLIPFNSFPGSEFEAPDEAAVEAFQEILVKKNFTTMIRQSKGRDISGACGQLAGGREDGASGDQGQGPGPSAVRRPL
ncbi:MAG: 23S rRNA (adenine(2503)-C(2))-methyltransferase RlmN [Pseudomonadota bacterium]